MTIDFFGIRCEICSADKDMQYALRIFQAGDSSKTPDISIRCKKEKKLMLPYKATRTRYHEKESWYQKGAYKILLNTTDGCMVRFDGAAKKAYITYKKYSPAVLEHLKSVIASLLKKDALDKRNLFFPQSLFTYAGNTICIADARDPNLSTMALLHQAKNCGLGSVSPLHSVGKRSGIATAVLVQPWNAAASKVKRITAEAIVTILVSKDENRFTFLSVEDLKTLRSLYERVFIHADCYMLYTGSDSKKALKGILGIVDTHL
jgi:hypothetical protein